MSTTVKLSWGNLNREERAEYMRLQMSPSFGGRSAYYPEDCGECGACGTVISGSGWCKSCSVRHNVLYQKLIGGNK